MSDDKDMGLAYAEFERIRIAQRLHERLGAVLAKLREQVYPPIDIRSQRVSEIEHAWLKKDIEIELTAKKLTVLRDRSDRINSSYVAVRRELEQLREHQEKAPSDDSNLTLAARQHELQGCERALYESRASLLACEEKLRLLYLEMRSIHEEKVREQEAWARSWKEHYDKVHSDMSTADIERTYARRLQRHVDFFRKQPGWLDSRLGRLLDEFAQMDSGESSSKLAETLARIAWACLHDPRPSRVRRLVITAAKYRRDGWLGLDGFALLDGPNVESVISDEALYDAQSRIREAAGHTRLDEFTRVAQAYAVLAENAKVDPGPDTARVNGKGRPRGKLMKLLQKTMIAKDASDEDWLVRLDRDAFLE